MRRRHQNIPLLVKDNSTLYHLIAKKDASPATSSRQSCCHYRRFDWNWKSMYTYLTEWKTILLTTSGYCPRIPPPWRQGSNQPLRRTKRSSTPRVHQQRRIRDHRITGEKIPRYCWGYHTAGDGEGVHCKDRS